ncbi:NAD-dependent protein deacylase [Pueribacillus theae]|uniref:NAD-dependent protein deacetylase n=1 Tax=Pueribacillus theae TaxID=2171751 RepID=A0A2U1JRS6_9BACI|nr:NAD-dependent deacylase [Pueribacillus theae]PWA07705.1 NAD-dependent protein deacylase [Pueribacillus theae]
MLAQWLRESTHTVVFTGAGMSTESGLPDFRSARTGLWNKVDPTRLASIDALERNREEFLTFYQKRLQSVQDYKPHAGHELLAKWEKMGLVQAIITQNVDGFHHQAGSENVIELHGTLRTVHCHKCGRSYPSRVFAEGNHTCECSGFLRPSVVLFGEMLPYGAVEQAEVETGKADLFIVLGSSLTVSPANFFPVEAKENGAKLVIVNMEETDYDDMADLVIHDRKIGEVLQEVDEELN